MYSVYLHLSERVLNGYVACGYCNEKNICNYENVVLHFTNQCKQICKLNCDCLICQKTHVFLYTNDGFNVYVNRQCIKDYFFPSVKQFWGVSLPCFIIRDRQTGDIQLRYDTPAPAS